MLVGSDGLVDSSIALNLINNQIATLSVAPVRPLLDLPSLASARLDALERQVKLHLLDVDGRSHSPTDELVLHLTVTNNLPVDDSASAHSITTIGTPLYELNGVVAAESLEGNNYGTTIVNGLRVGHPTDLTFESNMDFTVAFWVWPDTQVDFFVGNVTNEDATGPGWWMGVNTNGAFTCNFLPAGASPISFDSAPLFAGTETGFISNQWMHCAVVFSKSARLVLYFVNGVNVGHSDLPSDTGSLGDGDMTIGGAWVTVRRTGPGGGITVLHSDALNELSVWRRALGPEEIQALYDEGTNGVGVVAAANGFQRDLSPTEPLDIVHAAMANLRLLQTERNTPVPQPRLTTTLDSTNADLEITAYGEPGSHYTLESSPDLSTWNTMKTNVDDSAATAIATMQTGVRFFRVKTQE